MARVVGAELMGCGACGAVDDGGEHGVHLMARVKSDGHEEGAVDEQGTVRGGRDGTIHKLTTFRELYR